jgi:hypothetical protein
MNFSHEYTAKQFIEFMPAELKSAYFLNDDIIRVNLENEETLYIWRDFIDHSFCWSDTKQGHAFWNAVQELHTFENWEAMTPKTARQHLQAMGEDLRTMWLDEATRQNPHKFRAIEEAFKNGSEHTHLDEYDTFYSFIGSGFNFASSYAGRDFWSRIRNSERSAHLDQIVADFNKPVILLNGDVVPRIKAVVLSESYYPAHRYVLAEETESINGERVLKSDIVTYYDQDNDRNISVKHKIEIKSTYHYIEERKYYAHEAIAHRHGYGKTPRGWEQIDSINFGMMGEGLIFERIADMGEDLVFINAYSANYGRYYPKTHSSVYQCAVSGRYYHEDHTGRMSVQFIPTAGAGIQLLSVSNGTQIPIDFEYSGQRYNLQTLQIENGRTRYFFSPESAQNFGLTLSHCPHCNNQVSQHHNREQCKRDHFKNERYSYHSRKPRNISSRSEFKIGVEIEKESYEGAIHSCYEIYDRFGWVKESDGSLCSHTGYELVSPAFGLFGNNLIKEAEALEARFPSLINGDASNACGGHIHFSRANTSGRDTLEMYCGYLPLLYAIYKGRTKQNYCQGKEKEEMKHSSDKYQAVRVLDNRIEFRIFPKVKNLTTLKWRINLLRYMAKHPTANPVQVVNDLCDKRTTLHALFLEIFSEQTIYKRALDTLTMAQRYDRNYYNIDFSTERKSIQNKAVKASK